MVVSHAIAALEARHETKLFDRIGRRIALTEAGRVFLMEARAILARAGAAELALSEFGSLKRAHFACRRAKRSPATGFRAIWWHFSAPIPAFGYSAPHPSAGGTLTLLFMRCPAHTTNLSATPGRPACPSRASGWFRGPRLGASRIS